MISTNENKIDEKKLKVLNEISQTGYEHLKKEEWEKALHNYMSLTQHIINENILAYIAICQYNLKSYYESLINLKNILKINSKNISSIENIIKIYTELKQYENAIVYLHKLILIEPNNIYYNFNLGKTYFDRGWFNESIETLLKAIPLINNLLINKDNNELPLVVLNIYKFLGGAYQNTNNLNEAEYFYKKAFNYHDCDLEVCYNLGDILLKLKNYNEAIVYYEKFLVLNRNINQNPNDYIIKQLIICNIKSENYQRVLYYINKYKSIISNEKDLNSYNFLLGLYHFTRYEIEESLKCFNKCQKTQETYFHIGGLYYLLHDYENTKYYLEKAYELKNDCKHTIQSLCYNELKFKRFEKGFEWNEARYFCYAHKYTIPESLLDWDMKQPCKKLLVSSEQGIGDIIQFTRYLVDFAEKYPDLQISFLLNEKIIHLINLDFIQNVKKISSIKDFKEYDFKLYLFTIPYLLKIRNITPYSGKQYIKTNDEIREKWKNTLNKRFPDDKPRVALFWSGLTTQFIEKTIKLDTFREIAELDIHLISVQKGYGEEELLLNNIPITSFDFDNGLAFQDTIGILQNVDLLLTIDTSVAHIAGLLGIKTWMMLGHIYDWRWFRNEKKTDWYNSVELFRAKKPRDWTPVINEVKERLISDFNLLKSCEIPEVPVSIGELFDKYSILEIKKEKINNTEKLKHINNELSKLKPIIDKFKIDPVLYYDLIRVNRELWNIEDSIRILEKNQDFSSEFVKLARSVYFKNDLRGEIKGKINKYFNSNIQEVKEYIKYKS